jgi:hypothetical protein
MPDDETAAVALLERRRRAPPPLRGRTASQVYGRVALDSRVVRVETATVAAPLPTLEQIVKDELRGAHPGFRPARPLGDQARDGRRAGSLAVTY